MILRLAKFVGSLVENKMLVRRSITLVSSFATLAFAYQGYIILQHRPPGAITAEEVALISVFAGTGGWTFSQYQRGRKNDGNS